MADVDAMRARQAEVFQRIFGGSPERYASENPRTLVEKNADNIRGKMAFAWPSERWCRAIARSMSSSPV
jgi:hypothetical protein